ncbi:hypothetical protein MARA_02270 (plasmid) [Mycolicibacterium arabiense]|uniref:Lipoprotein n=1 Tax=Mycolicibacterium arabiense TaxID=1286181 RepID=A0A7I7RQJ6_9MYCO|nr:hypothetical protein [Mycolicibacterium arabiense]BBY46797.1 hypothetical protein MARA_02270 [Mycolicibacterium arabiense]
MKTPRFSWRTVAVGGAAAATVLSLAACGGGGTPSPSTTPSTTTTSPTSTSPAPTEKSLDPHGGNLFTPPVHATPAPNIQGGQHPGINGIP